MPPVAAAKMVRVPGPSGFGEGNHSPRGVEPHGPRQRSGARVRNVPAWQNASVAKHLSEREVMSSKCDRRRRPAGRQRLPTSPTWCERPQWRKLPDGSGRGDGPRFRAHREGQGDRCHAISGAVDGTEGMVLCCQDWRRLETEGAVKPKCTRNTRSGSPEGRVSSFRSPRTPLRNHGNFVLISPQQSSCGGSESSRAEGIQIFPGFPCAELLREGTGQRGVQNLRTRGSPTRPERRA